MPSSTARPTSCSGVNAPSFSEKQDRTSRCTNRGSDDERGARKEGLQRNRTGVRVYGSADTPGQTLGAAALLAGRSAVAVGLSAGSGALRGWRQLVGRLGTRRI